jgi:hypothetical protein
LRRIAFDLDETLGVPLIEGSTISGWQTRLGCKELLARLCLEFILCLWSVSSRRYVDKALSFGLNKYFSEVYSGDEMTADWKDIRQIQADFLVDDSPHHREVATKHGLESAYIIVPAYGSPEDIDDPLKWVRQVEATVLIDKKWSKKI